MLNLEIDSLKTNLGFAEVPEPYQEQLTQTLIVCLLNQGQARGIWTYHSLKFGYTMRGQHFKVE